MPPARPGSKKKKLQAQPQNSPKTPSPQKKIGGKKIQPWTAKIHKLCCRGTKQPKLLDLAAALVCTGASQKTAKIAIQTLLEKYKQNLSCAAVAELLMDAVQKAVGHEPTEDMKERLQTNLILGILKDFERRSITIEDFDGAAEARFYANEFRDLAQERMKQHIASRHTAELDSLLESHVVEAVKFNQAWASTNKEFESEAHSLIEELRKKQDVARDGFHSRQEENAQVRVKQTREMIELKQVQGRLARSGNYVDAQRYQRKIGALKREDSQGRKAQAEAYVKKKMEAFNAAQKVEMDALLARVDRSRRELRARWTRGADRLMQSHKNMLNGISSRHTLETNQADTILRSELAPLIYERKRSPKPPSARSSPSRSSVSMNLSPDAMRRPSKAFLMGLVSSTAPMEESCPVDFEPSDQTTSNDGAFMTQSDSNTLDYERHDENLVSLVNDFDTRTQISEMPRERTSNFLPSVT